MKTRLVITSLAAVVLLSPFACRSAPPNEVSIDVTSSGKEVTVPYGTILTVTLESNMTTGYRWTENAKIGDSTVLQQTDHKYQPPGNSLLGAAGKEVWTFKTLNTGRSTVSMEYSRHSDATAVPAKTFIATFVVE